MTKQIKIAMALLLILTPAMMSARVFNGELNTEWQWDMNNHVNWVNLLRLDLEVSPWEGGSFQVATLHMAKTGDTIIDDWQGFSNIEDENTYCAIAVLGYMQTIKNAHLFVGVRNTNEDYFTSDCTSFFTGSSPGMFPTIGSSYPIANYPVSGLTIHFDISFGRWTFMNSLYNGRGYNGWSRHDNPFIVNMKRDGVFDIMQLTYEHDSGYYSAGAAIHSRLYLTDEDGELTGETLKKSSCALWIYGEQAVWENDDKKVSVMAQYSENTRRQAACYRYAEVGGIFDMGKNHMGLSGQLAEFQQGRECSLELTYQREITDNFAIQPTFMYINNHNGNYTVLCGRFTLNF